MRHQLRTGTNQKKHIKYWRKQNLNDVLIFLLFNKWKAGVGVDEEKWDLRNTSTKIRHRFTDWELKPCKEITNISTTNWGIMQNISDFLKLYWKKRWQWLPHHVRLPPSMGRGKAHLEGSKEALGVCLVTWAGVRAHCLDSLPPDDQIIRHYSRIKEGLVLGIPGRMTTLASSLPVRHKAYIVYCILHTKLIFVVLP